MRKSRSDKYDVYFEAALAAGQSAPALWEELNAAEVKAGRRKRWKLNTVDQRLRRMKKRRALLSKL